MKLSAGIPDPMSRAWAGLVLVLMMALLLTSGCMETARKGLATLGSRSDPFQEFVGDPVALATVKTVVVLPFQDRAREKGFRSLDFSTRLANQLTSRGKLKVIYPEEIMRLAEEQNERIRRHNSEYRHRRLLGRSLADARPDQLRRAREGLRESVAGEEQRRKAYLAPVTERSDAIKLARMLGADAVVMGRVTDYDPYMRPRISLMMQVIATGTTEDQARALAELCQWGVPRRRPTASGVVWQRQQNFDARDGNIGHGAYMEALTHHVDHQVHDTEAYVRSPSLYADYVGAVLAGALLKARIEAVKEAEMRAMAEAKQRQAEQAQVRQRLEDLIHREPQLPDPDAVVAQNHRTKTESQWRPDLYLQSHPRKAKELYTGETKSER